ncbi:hypothetical protein F4781DRAFT_434074 [Annulohypoxylon bovei var. microspora]|nr:hypothetical protein F4781DRAFT_434074 [Annulohypoxylon bovei var. microspora]
MPCSMPECHHVRPNGSKFKLNHDKNTSPGAAFYYCSIHRVYHCIAVKTHRRLPQPLCGECAWLFFRFPAEATRYPNSDIGATAGPNDEMMAGISPVPSTPGDPFGREDTATSVSDPMDLDGPKRSFPTLAETFRNLQEQAQNSGRRPQRMNRKRPRRNTSSIDNSQNDMGHNE